MPERPDFMILGGRTGSQVWLMASRTIRDVSVTHNFEYDNITSVYRSGYERAFIRDTTTTVNARVRHSVTVIADSYPEAWNDLFDCWAPEGPPGIEGQRALP